MYNENIFTKIYAHTISEYLFYKSRSKGRQIASIYILVINICAVKFRQIYVKLIPRWKDIHVYFNYKKNLLE